MMSGCSKRELFISLKNRVWSKLQNWGAKRLSQAGRMVLIKAVAQVIPTYAMGCFLLPDRKGIFSVKSDYELCIQQIDEVGTLVSYGQGMNPPGILYDVKDECGLMQQACVLDSAVGDDGHRQPVRRAAYAGIHRWTVGLFGIMTQESGARMGEKASIGGDVRADGYRQRSRFGGWLHGLRHGACAGHVMRRLRMIIAYLHGN
ncbi:UNVERIFIED_CONTAM: hypothetical protein Scaly_3053100 [Sesamum calycinum]|uniref:Uncharacterized protein n=1 Tax=Sesamum calycinum TaxID=2727403 RepID=A0AAW2K186_9LAMI